MIASETKVDGRKRPEQAKHLAKHQWKKGQTGNPKGRAIGSRNALRDDFFRDLSESWIKYGKAALMSAAWTAPLEYVRIVASLMPRDLAVEVTNTTVHLGRMSTSELQTLIREYRGSSGNRLEASEDKNGVFTVGETVRSRAGEASPPADGEADKG
jgi:hypothetical protein